MFIKLRVMSFEIRIKHEEALEKHVADDIIEKVQHFEWASPTVLIVKPNGDLRICGDYSVTINKFSGMEQYLCYREESVLPKLTYPSLDINSILPPKEGSTPPSTLFVSVCTNTSA